MYKKVFNIIKTVLDQIGRMISAVINFILLGIVYFIAVGFTSIMSKLFGRHFLDLKPKKGSNWAEHKITKEPKENYYRMF